MAAKIKTGPMKARAKKEVKKMPQQKPQVAQAAKATQAKATTTSSGNGENKLIAALAYVIQFWVPLFILLTEKKNDRVLKFHAMQSLLFTVAWIVLAFVLSIVGGVLAFATGGLAGICVGPLMLVPFLYALFVAYKVYNGEKYMVPVLGEQAQKMA